MLRNYNKYKFFIQPDTTIIQLFLTHKHAYYEHDGKNSTSMPSIDNKKMPGEEKFSEEGQTMKITILYK